MSKNFKKEEQFAELPKDKTVPTDNFIQQKDEIPSMPDKAKVNMPKSDFKGGEIQKVEVPNEKTKTFKAAEVVTGSSSSGLSGDSATRRVVFGGGAVTDIGKDVSATTRADKADRSGSRMGKRFDPISKRIDYDYPELVEVSYKQSKPLSETDSKQGYNGNYINEHSITQRNIGGAPADPLFNRSVDLISMDMGYYTEGQYNTATAGYDEFAVSSYNVGDNDYDSPLSHKKGSYMINKMVVTFNGNGAVGFSFVESDLANRNLDESTARVAGDAALRSYNQIELDRLQMISNASNENLDNWNPLGDAIVTPSAVNHYLYENDAYAGDNVFMSRRKIAMALSYAINKVAKDGVRKKGPMAEMCNGNIEGAYSSALHSISESDGFNYAFNTVDAFKKGSAGLWIAINDTVRKYTSKGKLYSYPQSFKNALAIADANMAPLRMHEMLYKDVCHAELFSTVDGGYDPFKPLVLTDKAALIHPISAVDTATVEITKDTTLAENVFPTIFTFSYMERFDRRYCDVHNLLFYGIWQYFRDYASKYCSQLGNAVNGIWTLEIPVQSSTTSISLWDLIVCSAIPYIIKIRKNDYRKVIEYENNFGYPYSKTIALKDVDVDSALNYTFSDPDSPLIPKIGNPVDLIKVKFPEVFWSLSSKAYDDEKLGGGHGFMSTYTVLPHYFCQNQFEFSNAGIPRLGEEKSSMCYPSTRSGVELSDMDTIYGLSEEDYRLALDRMVVYPGYDRVCVAKTSGDDKGPWILKSDWITTGTNHYEVTPSLTYKYGITTSGIPVLPYLASAEDEDEYARCLTILDVMRTPREMGLHFVMPAGVLTPVYSGGTANFRNVNSGYLAVSGPGFTAYVYHSVNDAGTTTMQDTILTNGSNLIAENESYTNGYFTLQATPDNVDHDFGMVFSISRGMKCTATAHTFVLDGGSFDFVPFVTGSYEGNVYDEDTASYALNEQQATPVNSDLNVVSLQKYFWTRLQRLPFVINPFDANASDQSYNESAYNAGNKYDIYDFLYMFGFCGFRASDYTEITYERDRQRIALGMNYVDDPYISKTLLLK